MIQATDGALYGTTYYGGANQVGGVFKLNTDGTGFVLLHSFSTPASGGVVDGAYPAADLLEGNDGALYGTTSSGGTNSPPRGSVFKLNKDGTGYTLLLGFSGPGLVEGLDGALYGSTEGIIYKMNHDGTGFAVVRQLSGTGGGSPSAQLVQRNSVFYGESFGGGDLDQGVVFRLFPPQTPDMIAATFKDGTAQVMFTGMSGYNYSLSRSMDLSVWTVLGTNVMPSEGFYTNIDNTPGAGAGFYRAAWVPR